MRYFEDNNVKCLILIKITVHDHDKYLHTNTMITENLICLEIPCVSSLKHLAAILLTSPKRWLGVCCESSD